MEMAGTVGEGERFDLLLVCCGEKDRSEIYKRER